MRPALALTLLVALYALATSVAAGPATVWLDMVSLFPRLTFKNRPNGMRPDLAGMLANLRPAFGLKYLEIGNENGGPAYNERYRLFYDAIKARYPEMRLIADVVVMASYAPLFANVNYKKWNPDLINFDSSRVFGTPSYWVQKLFSENRGEAVLPCRVTAAAAGPAPLPHGAVGVGTWNTQAEYKDLKVTQGDKVILESSFASDAAGWKPHSGEWKVQDGAYRQMKREPDDRSVAGDPAWTDYTLSLKARKLGGAEGFLIMFHAADHDNFAWWNLGGWGNSKHAIEVAIGGSKSHMGADVTGKIETGRWYDIRIELKGRAVKCFLDGKLVHDATYPPPPSPLYAVAGRAGQGEIILKVVNVSGEPQETAIELAGAKKVGPTGAAIVLKSASPQDENTLEQPMKVAPVTEKLQGAAAQFKRTFPPWSVTVLRLKVE